MTQTPATSLRTILLAQASEIVSVDREHTHGAPEDNFAKIAGGWNWWLAIRAPGPLTGLDVAMMMDLFKTARLSGNLTHTDSWLDKLGYTAAGGEIALKEVPKS